VRAEIRSLQPLAAGRRRGHARMTVATLVKTALLAYGVLVGAAFLYLRLYPEVAGRTVFEWRNRLPSIAGALVPAGGVEQSWLKDVPVDLLDGSFATQLSLIAADARTSVEAMARKEADRLQERAVSAVSDQLTALDRRLSRLDAGIVAAAAAVEPAAPLDPTAAAGGRDSEPAAGAAGERAAQSHAARLEAEARLASRVRAYLSERRREQALRQLRIEVRRSAASEGGGIEIRADNSGPFAVTGISLSLSLDGEPVALLDGRIVPANNRAPWRFAPEIVNEYDDKILGLPPRSLWRTHVPLDAALEGRGGAVSAELLDADFADADRLERATPYGSGMRVWAYPEAASSELFADDLKEAAAHFQESALLAEAKRAEAAAAAELAAAQKAASERRASAEHHAAADATAAAAERSAKAAGSLAAAQAERERLAAERAALAARLDRLRAGAAGEAAVLAVRPSEEALSGMVATVTAALSDRIAAARDQTRLAETRSDETGAYRFGGIAPGTYYIYSPLRAADGARVNYLQRVRLDEDGDVVLDPPVVMTPGEFLHGILEAGL
jgi:hypothetical protein